MDNKQDENIENLVDKLMKSDELLSTSYNFTNAIMSQIEELKEHEIYAYKPIISIKVWFMISSFVFGLLAYLVFYGNLTKSKWLNYFEFDINLNFLPEFNFSNTTLYATLIVSLLFFIQIIMLKQYFNKRLSI